MDLNIRDHYIRRPDDSLFSTKRMALVTAADPELAAWQDAGGVPSAAPLDEAGQPTEAALDWVLIHHGLKVDLPAYAANVRWARETGGITVAGLAVRTDRESQALIAGARALAEADRDEPVQFKAAGGFETIDSAAMTILALEVGRHVRACFRIEAEVAAAITAGTITTKVEIDAAFAALG